MGPQCSRAPRGSPVGVSRRLGGACVRVYVFCVHVCARKDTTPRSCSCSHTYVSYVRRHIICMYMYYVCMRIMCVCICMYVYYVFIICISYVYMSYLYSFDLGRTKSGYQNPWPLLIATCTHSPWWVWSLSGTAGHPPNRSCTTSVGAPPTPGLGLGALPDTQPPLLHFEWPSPGCCQCVCVFVRAGVFCVCMRMCMLCMCVCTWVCFVCGCVLCLCL